MLRLDVTSLVWAFFRPEEKEDYMEVRKEDQRDPDEKVVEIEIERLRDFMNITGTFTPLVRIEETIVPD